MLRSPDTKLLVIYMKLLLRSIPNFERSLYIDIVSLLLLCIDFPTSLMSYSPYALYLVKTVPSFIERVVSGGLYVWNSKGLQWTSFRIEVLSHGTPF